MKNKRRKGFFEIFSCLGLLMEGRLVSAFQLTLHSALPFQFYLIIPSFSILSLPTLANSKGENIPKQEGGMLSLSFIMLTVPIFFALLLFLTSKHT